MKFEEKLKETSVENILSESFLDYSMSVIIQRALPDVRDGLKPVHRRILYAMNDLGMVHNRPFKKSARIVGEVIGKYHPHGDTAVYDTMVRMAQDWKMRTPLIDGQGNFGSIDGDAVAAMRYTESRLKKVASELLRDIDSDTIDFKPNFDGEESEPVVLPGRFPQLLANGAEGIAVGMATSMAPHHLGEVIEAILAQMDNKDITVEELMQYIKGPDFPTGSQILGMDEIKKAYETGRGNITIRGVVEKDFIDGKDALVIKEIPYQVIKERLIGQIKEIQSDYNEYSREMKKKAVKKLAPKGLDFLHDVRDETDSKNANYDVRVVIELKNGVNPDLVLNYLYKHTALQTNFSIINLALVPKYYGEGQMRMEPRVLTLKELIAEYVKHQQVVLKRKLNFDLNKKEAERHLLDALMRALGKLDETISIIRAAKTKVEAVEKLMNLLSIDERQTAHILALRLQTLASYEQDEKIEQHKQLLKEIEGIQTILASEEKMNDIIKEDIREMGTEYTDARRTEILPAVDDVNAEDLIPVEEVIITMTHNGFVKRMPLSKYRTQRKNGRGVNGMNTYEDDFVRHLQIASTHDTLMFFSNTGAVYKIKAYQVPVTSALSKGVSIKTVFDLAQDEQIQTIVSIKEFNDEQYLVFGTKKGNVKRTVLGEYDKSSRNGIRAITLNEDDEVVNVSLTGSDNLITLIAKSGKSITFNEDEVRVVSRNGKGVRGIDLAKDDEIVTMSIHKGLADLFIATTKGFGKKTALSNFRVQTRGGKGVRAISTNDKNGVVMGTAVVEEDEQLILLTKQGTIIKMNVADISKFGRNAQGSRVINLKDDDELIALDRNSEQTEEEILGMDDESSQNEE